MPTGAIWGQYRGGIRSLKNAIRTTLLRPSAMWLTSDKPLRCKGLQRIAKYGNMISRGVGNIWQSFQIGGGYECIKREYVTPIKRGAIAVFVDVGSSSSRWFRRREGRSRVFCFPTKEMNHEERLGKSPFTGLPNVKGTVAEDARITDSPPRSEPVLEIRVRPRGGMLRCSRAANAGTAMIRGGVRVADDGREPEDRERFSARRVARRRKTPPIGSLNG